MTIELTNKDLNEAAAACFLQGRLSKGKYYPKVNDKQAAAELAAIKQVENGTYDIKKNTLVGHDAEWKEADKAINAAYTLWATHTLPISTNGKGKSDRGPRLIPAAIAMWFIPQVDDAINDAQKKIQAFIDVYEDRVNQVCMRNSAIDHTMFPTKEEIEAKFHISRTILPMSALSDFSRVPIDVNMAEYLGNEMAQKNNAAMEYAMGHLIDKVSEKVSNMATQLTKHANGEKNRLFDTLVTNVKDMNEMLKTSNYLNDPALDELSSAIDELTQYETNVLRASLHLSDDVAKKAHKVTKLIDGLPAQSSAPKQQQMELPLEEPEERDDIDAEQEDEPVVVTSQATVEYTAETTNDDEEIEDDGDDFDFEDIYS